MKTRLPAFEVLVDLARTDPEGLERLRRSLTRAVIQSAASPDNRRRLEGLQFRIDMERRRAPTPLAATIRISEMMCHSLADLHRSMVAPEELRRAPETPPGQAGLAQKAAGVAAETSLGARILDFPKL